MQELRERQERMEKSIDAMRVDVAVTVTNTASLLKGLSEFKAEIKRELKELEMRTRDLEHGRARLVGIFTVIATIVGFVLPKLINLIGV